MNKEIDVKIDAILDTGSSFINLDQKYVEMYYKNVQGATLGGGGWIFPCNTTLPDLDITVGGYTAKVLGYTLNDGQISATSKFRLLLSA
jgi:hypothetical protein